MLIFLLSMVNERKTTMCYGFYKYLDDARILGPSIPEAVNCDPYTYSTQTGTLTSTSLPAVACIGQRTSDGKYQLLMSNTTPDRTHVGYYIVYNGSDPTATVFSTVAQANEYLNTNYVSSPPSKLFDDHSSDDVKTAYSSVVPATFYESSYSRR